MDLQKSFRIALATRGINKQELAVKMQCTGAYITQITKGGSMSVSKLQDVCTMLDYKVWEFIKLGEDQ
ncbi:helix-turn-helix domain-containing protein [Pseudoalteromonas sp.]|uniref:helix-turn-helix domain-containing protein n=1 Tax=Pseudoalteromonas sp. TaxID=53249 RepID=UPI00356A1D9E